MYLDVTCSNNHVIILEDMLTAALSGLADAKGISSLSVVTVMLLRWQLRQLGLKWR